MNANPKIPFEFIMDYLYSKKVRIKPMFGCFAVYVNSKIVFILRERKEKPELNGVWVASSTQNIESLSQTLQAVDREVQLVESKKSNGTWLLIPLQNEEFETTVIKACELVSKGDERIGKTTASSLM
jgi:hypothetical protein